MTKTIKVAIVDDEVDLRENIAGYVDSSKGFRCLGVHSSAEEALVNLPKEKPDVVLMDINMGGMICRNPLFYDRVFVCLSDELFTSPLANNLFQLTLVSLHKLFCSAEHCTQEVVMCAGLASELFERVDGRVYWSSQDRFRAFEGWHHLR